MSKKLGGKLEKFELNSKGVQELLRYASLGAVVKEEAEKRAAMAGEGYKSEFHVGKKRVYANIFPDTKEAARDNFLHNTMEKVIRRKFNGYMVTI